MRGAGIFAQRDDWHDAAMNQRGKTVLCVISSIQCCRGDLYFRWSLREQFRQYQRITHPVFSNLGRANVQRFSIKAQMHLAPSPTVFSNVFLALPFSFAKKLYARISICRRRGPVTTAITNLGLQCTLAANCGVIRCIPIKICHLQQITDQT